MSQTIVETYSKSTKKYMVTAKTRDTDKKTGHKTNDGGESPGFSDKRRPSWRTGVNDGEKDQLSVQSRGNEDTKNSKASAGPVLLSNRGRTLGISKPFSRSWWPKLVVLSDVLIGNAVDIVTGPGVSVEDEPHSIRGGPSTDLILTDVIDKTSSSNLLNKYARSVDNQSVPLVCPAILPPKRIIRKSFKVISQSCTASVSSRSGQVLSPKSLSGISQESESVAASSRTSSVALDPQLFNKGLPVPAKPESPSKVDEEVVAMLKRTFPDLADRGIIEDVLVSVSNPDKAFEQLQILQDEFLAADAQSSPVKPKRKISWDGKLAFLATFFPEVPDETVSRLLHEVDGDLSQAQNLLTSHEQQKLEETDRLAAQLNRELDFVTHLQAEEGRSSGQPEEAQSVGEKVKVHQLSQHFPSTTQDVVLQAFRVCAGNLDMAIEVLKGEGYEFLEILKPTEAALASASFSELGRKSAPADFPPLGFKDRPSPARLSQEASRSSSPRSSAKGYASHARPQAVYMENRRAEFELQEQINALRLKRDKFFENKQFLDSDMEEVKIQKLIRELKELKRQSSARIFRELNKDNLIIRKIDFHGQHVHEAISRLHRVVNRAVEEESEDTEVTAVTGRGNGSVGNVARVRQAVIKYLDQRGISWSYEEHNDGALKFVVHHQRHLKPYNQLQVLSGSGS